MHRELCRQNVRAWLSRVSKFKQSEFFQSPPPLMSLQMERFTGLFLPRQALWLEEKIEKLVFCLGTTLSFFETPESILRVHRCVHGRICPAFL